VLTTRRLAFLGVAVLLSGGTVFLTQQWLQGELSRATTAAAGARAAQPVGPRVLVASQPLPAGTVLKSEHLRWQAWPAGASTAGYVTDASTTPDQMAGAVVRNALDAGEPLTANRVARPGDRSFLAAVLKPGHRAVTVNVSASTGVAGFVFPGDHVDLILSRAVGGSAGGQQRMVSETVLSDLRVVAIDQRAANEKNEIVIPTTVTLEVTPKHAEVVALITEMGKLSLSLRSLATPADATAVAGVTRTWDHEATSGGMPRAAAGPSSRPGAAARPAAAPATVQVVRGVELTSAGAAK
jgi:pilus assembly protein CpaB